jgi:hypothetical protein
MTTALALTAVGSPVNLGQKLGYQCMTMQMPTAFSAGGNAITADVSSLFSTIFAIDFDTCITGLGLQAACNLGVVGTADATNGGVATSSAVKICCYISGGSAAALAEDTATDYSTVTAAPVVVWGILK